METVVVIMSRPVPAQQLTRKAGLMYDSVGSLATPGAKVRWAAWDPCVLHASTVPFTDLLTDHWRHASCLQKAG
jgi:hypothetical protein